MTRLRRHPDARATELEGEAFLVRPESDAILRLNPMAAALWRALTEPTARDDLVRLFVDAFPDEPADRLARDVDAALTALEAAGMLLPADD